MKKSESSDHLILVEIGERIKSKRLNINLSQLDLAKKSGISRRTVQAIELGESISLSKFIAILRTLDALDAIDNFIPKVEISPLQLAKSKGKIRKRAYKKHKHQNPENESTW